MESAVVVYLRELYYPNGFSFPMVPTSPTVFITELLREAATLVMLYCVGLLAGSTRSQRFVYFLYSFAIWDIFYYVFLRLLIHWPESLFTWDILFLIPIPWYGPVIAPVIISLTMMAYAWIVLHLESKAYNVVFKRHDWIWMSLASLLFIISFTMEFVHWFRSGNHSLNTMGFEFIPSRYPWWLFMIAESILLYVVCRLYLITKNSLTLNKTYVDERYD